MKYKAVTIFITLSVLVFTGMPVASAQIPASAWLTYKGSGFSMKYPKNWSVMNMGTSISILNIDMVEFSSPESDQSVFVRVVPLAKYTYANAKSEYLRHEAHSSLILNSSKILEKKTVRLNRRPAQYISLVRTHGDIETAVTLLARESNNAALDPIIVGFQYSANEGAYSREMEKAFLQSLRVTLTKEVLEREKIRKKEAKKGEELLMSDSRYHQPTFLPKGMVFGWRDQQSTAVDGVYGVTDWYQCPNTKDAYLIINHQLTFDQLRGVIDGRGKPEVSTPVNVLGNPGFIEIKGSSVSLKWTSGRYETSMQGCSFPKETLLQIAESMK